MFADPRKHFNTLAAIYCASFAKLLPAAILLHLLPRRWCHLPLTRAFVSIDRHVLRLRPANARSSCAEGLRQNHQRTIASLSQHQGFGFRHRIKAHELALAKLDENFPPHPTASASS